MTRKEEYNAEPVYYCTNCLSLGIKELKDSTIHTCLDCGNINVKQTDIDTWAMMYDKEYGKPFLSSDEKILEE